MNISANVLMITSAAAVLLAIGAATTSECCGLER